MHLDDELGLLCDTFKKSRVRITRTGENFSISCVASHDIYTLFGKAADSNLEMQQIIKKLSPKTIYKFEDEFRLCYIYIPISENNNSEIIIIGPYLSSSPTHEQMLEIGEQNGLAPKNQKYFNELYSSIPILTPDSHLFIMLSAFCERLWKCTTFSIVDLKDEFRFPASPINKSANSDDFESHLINMKAMEMRYNFENDMINAVSSGQLHKEAQIISSLTDYDVFEKRAADPLRNAKNYCIIMNTLLRKAAEKGGVHPIYIDAVSRSFALEIEQTPSLYSIPELMADMFRSYCRLVRKHAIKNYSPIVKNTILLIDSDLSANLSLNMLAKEQNVSSGYLSTIFKRETQTTISKYIRDKRIKHALYLLSTTHLQIQTVALHCGIIDVQYFSKIFKKQTGMTPKEYRESAKKDSISFFKEDNNGGIFN